MCLDICSKASSHWAIPTPALNDFQHLLAIQRKRLKRTIIFDTDGGIQNSFTEAKATTATATATTSTTTETATATIEWAKVNLMVDKHTGDVSPITTHKNLHASNYKYRPTKHRQSSQMSRISSFHTRAAKRGEQREQFVDVLRDWEAK